ncbi:MAG: exodeoxyribonuclease III [Alphaproteobacteria bacterium]|nr:exodeoxyribonuclease III [Alphaproteobacteria bacterium]
MRIATWNINSIKVRQQAVCDWLAAGHADVLCLQEIKCEAAAFPADAFRELGYDCAVVGQKSYNGVALLSKLGLEDVREGLPGDDADAQARYVEATVQGVRIGCLYLPNGNPPDDPAKYDYKLAWMQRLEAHARDLLRADRPFLLAGDYNVIPAPEDCWDVAEWREDALYRLPTRQAFRRLVHLGLTDAFRAVHPEKAGAYSFWDYQKGRWHRGEGIRIDHLLLSPAAADRLTDAGIDKEPRGKEKASDHTPVWIDLADTPPRPLLAD